MARAAECLAAIEAAAQGKLSDEELEGLLDDLSEIRNSRAAGQKLDALEQQMFDRAEQIAEDVQLAAKIEKRNRLRNIVVKNQLKGMVREAMERHGDASLGLEAALVGINAPLANGRLSADARGKALLGQYFGGLHADLRKAGLDGVFRRQELSREISRELWDLSLKAPTGTASNSKEAKQIAKIIHKYRRAAIERENRAGAYIRYRQGYVTRQSHDRVRMMKRGFDEWFRTIESRLDWDAMDVPADKRREFAQSAYGALVTGVRKEIAGGAENDLLFAFKGPGNLAKKESASRTLVFKSADDWFDYNETFGSAGLNEAIIGDFGRAARNTALMETFGTNPRAMFDAVRQEMEREVRDMPDGVNQVKRLQRHALGWYMDEVDGTIDVPASEGLARVGAGVRALQTLASLGSAVLSAVSDLALVAAERRYQGRSLMGAWQDTFSGFAQGVAPGQMRDFGDMLGVGIEGQTGAFASRFVAQDDLTGRANKLMHLFFKYNLLGPWSDANKRGMGLIMARDLATKASKGWDGLDADTKRNLETYGITADKWEVLRKAKATGADGREYIMPGEIREDMFEGLSARKARAAKDELSVALATYISDRVDFGVVSPGARERALVKAGQQRGTVTGEAVRAVMQFKSFSATYMTKVLGRQVHGGKTDQFANGIPELVVATTVLGYFAMQAKEMAKGREPRDTASPETLIAAMAQGGGLGIYGDFLFGEANRFGNGFLETAAGPTLSDIATVVNSLQRARGRVAEGESPDLAGDALYFVKGNLPLVNMFYTKAAMDYLIWFRMQESINPGYLRRMERRMKREQNQEYFFPPSQAVR